MSVELAYTPLRVLAERIRCGELSPVEIVEGFLERIDRYDARLGTYITVCADDALETAQAAEREIKAGSYRGPLHGIPVVHKDNILTKGVLTTAHSKTLRDFYPPTDASFVARLKACGTILMGKTNTTEFACGDMAEYGPSRNPWNLALFSGASSGGSAGALAAGLAVAATGTDTGGSIRAPASMCGVVGVKPTFGRVSRHGVIPLSWTMDHAGPMTRTVADAALLLAGMAGPDALDPSGSKRAVPDFTEGFTPELSGVSIGVCQEHFFEGLEPAVENALHAVLSELEGLGAELRPLSLPSAGELAAAADVLVMAEAFSQHAARLRECAADYGPKARRRISTGAFYTSAEYQQAGQVRELWIRELDLAMRDVDALVTPTLPFTAFSLERQERGAPDTSWATRHFNLSGHPAMTLPCGFDEGGLPIGMQVVAKPFDESTMFRIGHAYQLATGWHLRRPRPFAGDDDA
ncbi:MAG: Asp-tRNA(Asn)/Glu-tRNA(Gln) amidotransferase subunit GatA [Trueperaceae bacterium]|nr:MAG: Asp-tRNA(Asn)/Glu-tRNA(Gln) amidotransferase subunit GatA [Trueperaceae bacterium]